MSHQSANRAQNRQDENKPERVPVDGMRDIMTVRGKDPAFKYRWVADTDEKGSRIWKYKSLVAQRLKVAQRASL